MCMMWSSWHYMAQAVTQNDSHMAGFHNTILTHSKHTNYTSNCTDAAFSSRTLITSNYYHNHALVWCITQCGNVQVSSPFQIFRCCMSVHSMAGIILFEHIRYSCNDVLHCNCHNMDCRVKYNLHTCQQMNGTECSCESVNNVTWCE